MDRCDSVHNITALSIVCATFSGVLMLFTIPLNAVLIYCIASERKTKYKGLFYKLVLNIAVADLLTGMISDPRIIYAWKEALQKKSNKHDVHLDHAMIFVLLTAAAALTNLILLSIDRTMALLKPIQYHIGMGFQNMTLVVVAAWPFATLMVLPYFWIKVSRQLLVFSFMNVIVCIIFLVVTTVAHNKTASEVNKENSNETEEERVNGRKRRCNALNDLELYNVNISWIENEKHQQCLSCKTHQCTSFIETPPEESSSKRSEENNKTRSKIAWAEMFNENSQNLAHTPDQITSFDNTSRVEEDSCPRHTQENDWTEKLNQRHHQLPCNSRQGTSFENNPPKISRPPRDVEKNENIRILASTMKIQKKITRSFIYMLCVFVVTYLPTCFTMVLMNTCMDCDCMFIHVMRDVSIVSILSSSVFRPLNFIFTLRHLRNSIYRLLNARFGPKRVVPDRI